MLESRSSTKPRFNCLPFVVAAAFGLGVASAWTPGLITPARAQTPPAAQAEILGEHAIATGRATANFLDAASRSAQIEKTPARVMIHRPIAGRAGAAQADESDGFDPADSINEDNSDRSRKRHRIRRAEFPGGGDNGGSFHRTRRGPSARTI